MFERYWKPHFDNWSSGVNNTLEKYLRSPSTLQGISQALNAFFRGKRATDKALYSVFTGVGLPSYRDQKKGLHLMTRVAAMVEDLGERLEHGGQGEMLQRIEEIEQRQAQIAQKLEALHQKLDEFGGASEEDAPLSEQFIALHQKLDALLAAPKAGAKKSSRKPKKKAAAKKSS